MPFIHPPSPASRRTEQLLQRLESDLTPSSDAQERVQRMVRGKLRAPDLLVEIRESLLPERSVVMRLWAQVLSSIDPLRTLSVWERLRESLRPADHLREAIWSRFSSRLHPAYVPASVSRPFKWVAAFAIVLVGVRVSSLLVLAPTSIAESSVMLLSQRGDVEVLTQPGPFWQQVLRGRSELALLSPTYLQTQQGTATIIHHDDAVFRFAAHTRGQLRDLSDRPGAAHQETTIALEDGELWVLGLVPKNIRAITVLTSQGRVMVHEGSVSIRQQAGSVTIRVFDRSAVVWRHGKQLPLVTGEQVTLTKDSTLLATDMDPAQFHESWVAGNLSFDAAHQRAIAQLQQERRAASAGILPGTAFYPVKRLAETVDVLLSFTEEERARKLITQANTRLNEAAALLQTGGETEAQVALDEYKDTLLKVASGSGGSSLVQSLIQTEVVEGGTAAVGAALPGDQAYALKQAVDDTIASFPATVAKPANMEGETLLDELVAVKRQVEEGNIADAKEKLTELTTTIASLETTGSLALVSLEVREEAKAVAEQVAIAVEGPTQGIGLSLGAPPKEVVLPRHYSRIQLTRPLTQEQVTAKAQEIRGRIFLFSTKKAQYDALQDQLSLISNHPDHGRILRELAKVLPRTGLAQRVLRQIRTVSEQVQQEVTASGTTSTAQ